MHFSYFSFSIFIQSVVMTFVKLKICLTPLHRSINDQIFNLLEMKFISSYKTTFGPNQALFILVYVLFKCLFFNCIVTFF